MSQLVSVSSPEPKRWTPPAARLGVRSGPIVARIAAEHGLTVADITGPSKGRKASAARQAAVYAMRVETPLTFLQIAAAVGRRDHTTILYAIHMHCERTGMPLPRGMVSTWYIKRRQESGRIRARRRWRQARNAV